MRVKIELEGITRDASYLIDTDRQEFTREYVRPKSDQDRTAETFKVVITDVTEKTRLPFYFSDAWIVLIGTPQEIETYMVEESALTVFHTQDIFQEIDRHGKGDELIITSVGLPPYNQVVANSTIYKTARKSQVGIVADMYGIERDEVIVLPDIQLSSD